MEEDEVYSVARLLGELVAYRASGTGHMELLAGLFILFIGNIACTNLTSSSCYLFVVHDIQIFVV